MAKQPAGPARSGFGWPQAALWPLTSVGGFIRSAIDSDHCPVDHNFFPINRTESPGMNEVGRSNKLGARTETMAASRRTKSDYNGNNVRSHDQCRLRVPAISTTARIDALPNLVRTWSRTTKLVVRPRKQIESSAVSLLLSGKHQYRRRCRLILGLIANSGLFFRRWRRRQPGQASVLAHESN